MVKINNRDYHESILNQLVKDIKKKKELATIDDAFVLQQLTMVLKQSYNLATKLNYLTTKSADYKQIIKLVRNNLRKSYGLFRTGKSAPASSLISLINGFKRQPNTQQLIKILQLHSSTKERLPYYDSLYQQLFRLTGNPKTILDLGCGLNPFSVPWMNLKHLTYHAYDISPLEIEAINLFFRIVKVKGQAQINDLTQVKNLPSVDIAFLFKMTDILDQNQGHKKTEEVLNLIPAKYVIISFPTLTMSGKTMKAPRRKWVEWLCNRLEYKYQFVEIPNELFYVIKKG